MGKYAYVGCRTTRERNARGKGIKVYEIEESGRWNLLQLAENLINPSYLCLDENGEYLYTIHGDYSEISAFSIDKESGRITFINTVSTGGVNPVHLSVDASNRWVFVANLQSGTVAVIPRNRDGSLGERRSLYTIPGLEEGTVSHPHQVAQDTSRRFLLVSCQGRKAGFGQVAVFRILAETGELEDACTVRSRQIAEPRHLVFHPAGRYCYGVNEKDYSVTFYGFDRQQGILTPRQILPTLPDTYTGDGWASGIAMEPGGRALVVSNRKHDSLTSFTVDRETGMLRYADCIKTGGEQPRFITMTPDGSQVLAANELSDTIGWFGLDPETGKMNSTGRTVSTESPVCVVFSRG